ncbi:tyrosine-type recombinase/integrase [Limnoraphis robusta Tam1]|uniref:tyrosine-type recombinase/integrase n=1 Tax=Limnoraphis robusta TaxID=1118279 RepID=UPI002B20A682|nr:tyrosine-type recombinase/integrase [Limnoraphis robusta]MEA5500469.1 tyrosine-type recombinase/integrase [Limnoraphis robusta BA-68 BA1]MEA5543199.1 tyrosine-type recombinase/integrase [Limnoraphis robusta Tam1]
MKNPSKRRKGRVGVSCHNGILRLSLPRFVCGGERRYLYLGLKDTPANRKLAEAKAQQIETDIVYERFDQTLERYRHQKTVITEQKPSQETLAQLYKQYIETRRSSVRPGTWRGTYLVILGHIQRSPFANTDPNLENTGYAQKMLDWGSQTLSGDTCRRLMVQLNACLKWAVESKRVKLNRSPFEGMAGKARKRIKKSEDEETDINPFTSSERDVIIEAFKTRFQHRQYYYYAAFCFYVGCRPSEAIALTWEDISDDLSKITFRNAIVAGVEGLEKVEGLKTQKKRVFPCNNQVQKLLREIQSTRQSTQGLVLPSTRGKVFSTDSFRKVWVKVLDSLGIEYRKPYQTRHTFITLCLEKGVDAKDVAKWVGNSAEIIYKNYAGHRTELSVPEL